MRMIVLVVAALLAGRVDASPSEIDDLVRADRPLGCTDYRYLFWDVYRAELWTDAAELPGKRFGLSLTYRLSLSREDLVESSVDEMARMSGRSQNAFASARTEMHRAFRTVVPGDRLTAWRETADRVRIFHNGTETGAITSHVDLFLAIWLGEKSRDPDGRAALLSGSCID